jgi:hypothetical protein
MELKLTAEKINDNWGILISRIDTYITEPRRSQLKEFYEKYQERIALMPASYKKEYHNAFPGGYVDHVIRVIDGALKINEVWKEMGVDDSTYTMEELVFSALNHDLGKIGDEQNESYIPQTDKWRQEKLGEDYMFNDKLAFASVPDRSLFLLQDFGIRYTFNEMVAIQTHDGIYDEGNKKYFMSFTPGQKPRTSLPFILHQADLMVSRIEFEKEWLPKLGKDKKVEIKTPTKYAVKTPTLSNANAPFANLLNNL